MLKKSVLLLISLAVTLGTLGQQNTAVREQTVPGDLCHPTVAIDSHDTYNYPQEADAKTSSEPRHWYTPLQRSEWWLVIVAAITGGLIAWQAWETKNSAIAAARAAKAALLNAEALISAERAWLLAELGWFDFVKNYISTELTREDGETVGYTELKVKLSCKNEGRSPLWVDSIHARMEILSDIRTASQTNSYQSYGTIDPVGVGKEGFTSLDLSCDGLIDDAKKFLSVTVIIKYHDPFGGHETGIGYSLSRGELFRQMGQKEKNWNT